MPEARERVKNVTDVDAVEGEQSRLGSLRAKAVKCW